MSLNFTQEILLVSVHKKCGMTGTPIYNPLRQVTPDFTWR